MDEKQIRPLSLVDALAHECMFKAPVVKDVAEERIQTAVVEPIKTKDNATKAEDTSKRCDIMVVVLSLCYCQLKQWRLTDM